MLSEDTTLFSLIVIEDVLINQVYMLQLPPTCNVSLDRELFISTSLKTNSLHGAQFIDKFFLVL